MISLLAEEADLGELLAETKLNNLLYQGDFNRGCVINEMMELKLRTNKKFFLDNHGVGIIKDYDISKIEKLVDAVMQSAFDNSG